MPPILLTRPQSQSERFAEDLRRHFGQETPIFISPVLRIEVLSATINLTDVDGLIFTSENGVRAYCELCGVPALAYCVGDRTALAARAVGMNAISADGNLNDLLQMLEARAKGSHLLHVRGEVTTADIESPLLTVEPVIAYTQVAVPLSAQAKELLCDEYRVIVPLFSPRSAQLLSVEIEDMPVGRLNAVCISLAVAQSLDQKVFETVAIAKHMEAGAMINEMTQLIDAHPLERR